MSAGSSGWIVPLEVVSRNVASKINIYIYVCIYICVNVNVRNIELNEGGFQTQKHMEIYCFYICFLKQRMQQWIGKF